MQTRILLIRNDYDPMTHYMHEWSVPVKELAENKGMKVDCIDGLNVMNSQIVSRIEKLNPNLIFLNGHGNSECFYGYDGQIAIDINDASLFKNKIVFSRACNCPEKLGKVSVKKHNCTSFIGYKLEFFNVRQTGFELHPRKDKISKPIWEASNTVPISLIKGSTVEEAIEASHKRTNSAISKLLVSKEELGTIDVLKAVVINDYALTYYGDGSAKI